MLKATARLIALFLLAATCGFAQDSITIRVNAAETVGPYKPITGFFGYDEPNFTYSNYGRKLIGELASVGSSPVYIRTHFMLATGDGTPSLKWGSTNAFTEDSSGKPVYDWTITDRIMDTYLQAGAKPFVEIGFMPKALSSHPEPYTPVWKPGGSGAEYAIGWAYPPKDYAKWGELVHQWVKHAVEKYGRSEVETWYWEVWNEPDISYWHGTPEEYDRLYDYAADGLKRALPTARIGGPASTGPTVDHGSAFLRQFLEHCANGKNAVTGAVGAPLDFVTFHAKGRTAVVDGHVQMRISKNAGDAAQGFAMVSSYPKFRNLPIVISESDPDGCAACSATYYPAERLPQRPALCFLRSGHDEKHVRAGGPRKSQYRGDGDVGVRIRRRAVLRGLSHAGNQRHRQAGAQRVSHGGPDARQPRRGGKQRPGSVSHD
jgi:xylan 1,4-beta-xylosidase